jgi:hypothetical protein
MYTFAEFIIAVYCVVDDALKVLTSHQSLRGRGFAPGLSDAEVIAMEIIAEYQGIDADKAIWQYFQRHWSDWFPQIPSRSNFVRQSANLWQYKQLIQRQLIETVNSQLTERFHFERIRCRDLWHLTSRVNRKILAHTLCCWLNHRLGRDLLQFEGLVGDA